MSNRCLTRYAMTLMLFLVSPTLAFAWTPGLKEAADAVALGVATAEQKMMVFVHNKEINLLAQEGKISDFVYASCQDDFFELNERFATQAVRDAGLDLSISDRKFNPGTDTDVNVLGKGGKKVTLDDIKRIEANYQNNVKQYFKNQGVEPPRGTINTETDFVPHPAHTDPDEFQKIARYVNQQGGTAYTDPKAASAQAKLGSTRPIAIDEAASFSSTMKDMADAKITKANQLRQEASTIRRSDPGRAEYLEAQARQYDYQASKYHERLHKLDDQLRKQYGLPEKPGRTPFDQAKEHITKAGRNPFTGKDAATIHSMHQNGLQRATDDMIDTLIDIAKKNPSKAGEISKALAREVHRLPNHRAGQAIDRIEDAMRGVKGIDPAFTRNVVAETRALKQAASASAKWASFKESIKDLSGFNRMTRLSVVMTAGSALIMAHHGISITLDNVKATDTLWDYFRNCYYHAVWEGTGIGPAFEQAEREEIERYMKEFEAGQDPSMVKHITFTILKTGVYMGRDAIIGLLYLPDTIWEYFTQEKGLEAYAAMQNELARVMRQMIQDRKDFDQLMARMKKMGLHEADAKPFLDCLCRGCGGSLGGLFNPGFVTDIGHGPCQCNGPLTIWKTPLPVADKEAQYACFNEVTRMRYYEAQEIFDKWHQQMRDANAKSVEEDMKSIKRDIMNRKALEDEEVARNISDRFATIKELLYPEDADYVQATVGPYLENHAVRSLEAGNVARAIDDLDRVLNKIGTRHPNQAHSIKQRMAQYEKWRDSWRETKENTFPKISALIGKRQPRKAAWEIENLEYMMLKAPVRSIPPAINDPDFLALKQQVTDLGKRYDQSLKQAWQEATTLEKAGDPRGASSILEQVLAEWEHPQEQAESLRRQIAYDRNRVQEAEEKIALGRQAEAQGNLDAAIIHYTASLKIQKDEGLQTVVERLRRTPSRPGQAGQTASAGTLPGDSTTGAAQVSSTAGGGKIISMPGGRDYTGTPTVGSASTTTAAGGKVATHYPVGQLDPHWLPLAAVGGNFDRFARFDGSGLVVDVPAGNHWGKTGLMAKKPMFKLSKKPVRVTVQLEPWRTTGVCVAFAATQHPDVALIDNAWMSWVRTENEGMGDFWIGNVQDAWAGRSKGVTTRTGGQIPAMLTYTLAPGTFTLTPAGAPTQTVAIGWLKEGMDIYPHIFSCPAKSGDASKFALTGFSIETEVDHVDTAPLGGGRDYTGYTPAPDSTMPSGPAQNVAGAKRILEDDTGTYHWIDATEVQVRKVHAGRVAFRSTGNNHFTHRLGVVGNYPGQYRYLDFWLYFDKPGADIQIQVQVDGAWGKRWGYEAGPTYDGYGWPMEGTTANQPAGQWRRYRLDLIEQLHIAAGQSVTGLAFSSDGGDVYYDSVYLLPAESPLPAPAVRPSGKRVLEDDTGGYQWGDTTVLQREVVAYGQAAFRSDGNDQFTADLGVVGDYPEQFRSLSFWVFPIGAGADIQLQVQVDGVWGKRWGYEAGPKYDGYGWAMEGTTTGLKPGVWQELKIDLMRDLKINAGQRITGLAFSSDGGDVYYDSVYLQPNPNPVRKPSFQPTGKQVLEDDMGPYTWGERTELQDYLVFRGNKAFRSTGNNHFTADLGVAGYAAGQFQSIGFWAFFMGPQADIQIQVQVNGAWGKRWGFDAGPVYDGYGWAMEGTTPNMPHGRWTWIRLDLLNQLKLKAGDRITGLAFSSDNGDVIYDSVWLLPTGAHPAMGIGSEAGLIGGVTPPAPFIEPPGGRDYTGDEHPIATADSRPGPGYLRIEACVDGSDWISLDNGRLSHQHRAFAQIGTHVMCPASHRVEDGGFIVDGVPVGLGRLPTPVGMAGIAGFELERGRGQVRMDGANRILIDDDGPSGPDVYIIRLYPSATAMGAQTVATVPGGRGHTAASAQGQLIFEVGNIGGTLNGPTKATRFTLDRPHMITLIRNYHWNSARGAQPGTIALKDRDGRTWGPWQTIGSSGQGGVPNAYWTAAPNVVLPAGTYTVVDSDPASWSHNAESGNRGFVRVEGYPTESAPTPGAASLPATGNAAIDKAVKEVDSLIDAVKSLKGLFGK